MKSSEQSKKKLLNYLDYFIESDFFQSKVKEIRKKVGIPEGGFEVDSDKFKDLSWFDYFLYEPKQLKKKGNNTLKKVNIEVQEVCKEFSIDNIQIKTIFRIYIYHNKKNYELLNDLDNMCSIADMRTEIEDREGLSLSTEEVIQILKLNTYPIGLRIHPSASQRDIVSYIKNNWDDIKSYLSHYKKEGSKFGKIRSRNPKIKERDRFIYKHRKKPYKEIASLVQKEFPEVSDSVDQGSIGKIISLEKQRRKEV